MSKSFTIRAIGRVASELTLEQKASTVYVRVPLIGNDYIGRDDEGARTRTTSVTFTAFGELAKAIAKNVAKGDQLFVEGHIEEARYERDGQTVYGYNHIVDEFTFGAPGPITRDRLARKG